MSKEGHFSNHCHNLVSFVSNVVPHANLAQAFQAQCHVNNSKPDWFVDSGASTHMAPSTDGLNNFSSYPCNTHVTFGNGHSLPIISKCHSNLPHKIKLHDILVVLNLTKNLLSMSKLTIDNSVDVLFAQPFFTIQDRKIGRPLA